MVKVKARELSKREKLDALIDWYEVNRPEVGRRIEIVATPAELAKLLKYAVEDRDEPPREQRYRGRLIVAIGQQQHKKSSTPAQTSI